MIQQGQPIAQHDYQRHLDAGLDPPPLSKETVRYWSDFNRVFFHPRSLVQIQDADLPAGSRGMEKYEVGGEIFDGLDREHDLLDRDLRPFVEECDQMQGLQIVAGVDDAWGGFAGRYVERIGDEYAKVPVWVWALEDGRGRTVVCIVLCILLFEVFLNGTFVDGKQERRTQALLNTTKSLLALSDIGSLYISISNIPSRQPPPYLRLDQYSPWHTSALQMAPVESITLPSRLRRENLSRITMSDMEATFTTENAHQKILHLEYSVKDHFLTGNSVQVNGHVNGTNSDAMDVDSDNDSPEPLDIDLFPKANSSSSQGTLRRRIHVFSAAEIFRGWYPTHSRTRNAPTGLSPRKETYSTPDQFPLPSSYPHIFNFSQQSSEGLAIHASVAASSAIADRIRDLAQMVGRVSDITEREDIYSSLMGLREEYIEGWEGEDSEWEDD